MITEKQKTPPDGKKEKVGHYLREISVSLWKKMGDELLHFWEPPGWTAKCYLMYVTLFYPSVRNLSDERRCNGE